ncbi:uncharacterized protein LOC126687575 [Mercurialis annua]|uniref:uncharacterized protein LOC126668427 n=2 Tax=Mercurialis annua TaxID=3986 RepID=UPI0024AE64E6|nr:uncharacterized protein LOC126668427 [Mercurialis annua]XP_050222410.2 uncharacterized protein LOC126672503 [Mercurialis annua]XP_050238091.2 uncharacterized protein LOC126687575 [Mercurialis annua]
METSEVIDEEPPEMRLYSQAHRKKDGSWIDPEAGDKYEQMEAIRSKALEEGVAIDGRKILQKVLDIPKSGYARGLGYGAKRITAKESEFEARLQAEKFETEKQVKELNDQIQNQQVKIDNISQSYSKLKHLVQQMLNAKDDEEISIDGDETCIDGCEKSLDDEPSNDWYVTAYLNIFFNSLRF